MRAWEYLRGIAPVSLCDWPQRVCSVLFFGGCNLRCPTCHNQSIAWHPQTVPTPSARATLEDLVQRAKWLDGIVLTGGEALLVPGLDEVIRDLRPLGLPIKVDSNGMRPDLIRAFFDKGLVDCFAVDVKGPWAKYPELTGERVSADHAREGLEEIFAMAVHSPESFYFRCTRVPCLTDEDIETTRLYLPSGFALTVQKYIEPPREDPALLAEDDG
ncbi:MAG: anaerobic ribonucleoside-triphosphate reductase activating protein [Desulfoplanes sp.]|nr:anaerobic ribonucleoside-triphosphate reductase activating protein [Desulfoplanes sp.]